MGGDNAEIELQERRLTAILAADIVGYSRLMGADEAGTLQALNSRRRALVDPTVTSHRGRIVKTTGDGMLVEFASAVDAVRCAVEIQRGMAERNEGVPPDKRLEFRIGINVGDIIGVGDDIYGDGVNVAARLEAMSEPGGIYVSRAVRDPVRDKLAFRFEDLGEVAAKNIARPIHVFRVRHDIEATRDKLVFPRVMRRVTIAVIALLAAVGVGAGTWFWHMRSLHEVPQLSLVVLPFENTGGTTSDDYLAIGITDDLTTALSHIPGAVVISRATAYTYRGKAADIRQIGRDLDVRYVVHGSVQRFGLSLRVNTELGSTETGIQLWSDSFDQPISDLVAGQEQIVIRMRSALNISLADIEAANSLRERRGNPTAFDLVLQARAISLLPQTKETVIRAMAQYQQALERDPNELLALTEMARLQLNALFFDILPYGVATGRARQYFERAKVLQPNAESVLAVQANLLAWEQDGLDFRRARQEWQTVATQLIEYYPSSFTGYYHLGTLRKDQGRFDEAISYLAKAIRLNPRGPFIKSFYEDMAYCNVYAGHDREGLQWADRALATAGAQPTRRARRMFWVQVVGAYRTGDIDTAKRLAKELNDQFPFDTWREHSPQDADSDANREQILSLQRALKAAGNRDHLDPNVDFAVQPDDVLHEYFEGKTPTTAPDVMTVSTEQLAGMLERDKPLVIDTMSNSWYRSVPGAVGLDFNGNTHGTFNDDVQRRLELKLRTLTGGRMTAPIVAMSFNVASFDGYNLALRMRHAGYTNVYWYRGGREAWEVAGKPEEVVRPTNW
jgi:adenylate cyclase